VERKLFSEGDLVLVNKKKARIVKVMPKLSKPYQVRLLKGTGRGARVWKRMDEVSPLEMFVDDKPGEKKKKVATEVQKPKAPAEEKSVPAGEPVSEPEATVPVSGVAARIVQLRDDGKTHLQIANELGVSRGKVWRVLKGGSSGGGQSESSRRDAGPESAEPPDGDAPLKSVAPQTQGEAQEAEVPAAEVCPGTAPADDAPVKSPQVQVKIIKPSFEGPEIGTLEPETVCRTEWGTKVVVKEQRPTTTGIFVDHQGGFTNSVPKTLKVEVVPPNGKRA